MVMKWIMKMLMKVLFRAEITGLEHYYRLDESGEPMLIVANHTSLLDGVLIGALLPGKTAFMIAEKHTHKWYEKFLLSFVDHFKVDFHNPYATKTIIQELKKGTHCMIFPEGRITTTGSMMKIYEGTGMVASKSGAKILPIYIDGAEKSKLSYLDGEHYAYTKQFWFPKIRLVVLPARSIELPAGVTGKSKHEFFKNSVYRILLESSYYGRIQSGSLFKLLVASEAHYESKEVCIEDINQAELSLKKLRLASVILGGKLQGMLKDEKRVGIMLPNVSGMPATFFALQAYGYVPAMLNFTAGVGPMRSACETAELKSVITSRKFVDVFNLEKAVESLSETVRIIYLEDIRSQIHIFNKLGALIKRNSSLPGYRLDENEEAVVLFTSGSEGAPKGVVLSHKNINANVEQISAMLTLLPGEQILNALPTFHSFGLTAGMLWPILKGGKVFLYPSPLHYGVIPELVYQLNVKLLFGTDTFYNGYAKKADPYDFYSIRALVAGAEKLRPETRKLYLDKFHTPIFEGYGVTETSPVLAVNIPQKHQYGTVGQFVPGVEHRLEPVPGIEEGGRLFVRGPNIMLGYLLADKPGILQAPQGGWHDTGDIVAVDEQGFVSIKGRAKRFAKIGGEMISLTAVESYINKFSPDGHHVVVAVSDKRKGEQLILVTNDEGLSRHTVKEAAKKAQVSEIMIPKTVILVEEIPVLGTGKTNYPEVQKIADRQFNPGND